MNDDTSPKDSDAENGTRNERRKKPANFVWPGQPGWVKEEYDEVDKLMLDQFLNHRVPIDLSDEE